MNYIFKKDLNIQDMKSLLVFTISLAVISFLSHQCWGYYTYAQQQFPPYGLHSGPHGKGVAPFQRINSWRSHVAPAPRYQYAAVSTHPKYVAPIHHVWGQQVTPAPKVKYASNFVKETTNVNYILNISPLKKKQVKEAEPKDVFIENQNDDESDDAETAPDFLEGDIAIPEGKSRLAIDFDKFPAKKWKNNTVPYRISRNHTASEVLIIESALQTMAFVSCVRFEKWDGRKRDYIHFQPDKKRKGCWSYIGHQGGRQQLSLEKPVGKDCNCFCSPGRAMHEIMHALGFYHEHARADRDKYIKIVKKNVRRGKFANFFTKSDDETSRNFDYDYKSIMHYGAYFFSKNKRGKAATIIPKDPGATIGQRVMLSRMDCMKINSLYNCFDGDNEHVRKIQMICAMVGI